MPRPTYYSPCIARHLVGVLYHEARHRRKPMTRLVNELLTTALKDGPGWQTALQQPCVLQEQPDRDQRDTSR